MTANKRGRAVGLREKSIIAIVWVSSGRIMSQAFSWVITIILARILLPEDFGLLAMAFILIGFLDIAGTFGMGAAIVQKENISEIELNSMFFMCIALGFFYYFLVYLTAPVFARFFNQQELVTILRILGLSFPIVGLRAVPYNLLTKELDFKKRSIAELLAVIGGGLCSVSLAVGEHGVMSLVFGSLARQVIQTALTFCFKPWKPRMIFSISKMKGLISFGGVLVGCWVLEYLNARSSVIIIGKIFGDSILGFYTMATQLAMVPVEKVTSIINQVTFPVFSKLQKDQIEMRIYFMKVTRFLALVTFPALGGIVLVSDCLIEIVLGKKWMPINEPLQMLCLVGIVKSVDQIIPAIFIANRKAGVFLRYTCLCIILIPISVVIGSKYELYGATAGIAITYPVCAYYLLRAAAKKLKFTLAEYAINISPGVVGTAIMGISVLGFKAFIGQIFIYNPLYIMIGSVVVGVVSYVLALNYFFENVRNETKLLFYALRNCEINAKA
jgi:O-antigen/teichoic acid export membrane protein